MTAYPAQTLTQSVAVLDDDEDLGRTIARLLARHGHTASSFVSSHELLAAQDNARFDCIVSDIQMSELDGFEFATRLRKADPCVALVFMTAWPTTADAVDAVRRYGGLDYLEKPIDVARLVGAVHEGLAWSLRKRRIAQRLSKLTPRERDVFELLARGHSNKEVADHLGISARTVEDHRASIVTKTQAKGLAQLVALSRGEIC
ncbi:response regulator transcription factor [Novosphingobium malaysiense]|uniref:Response regulator receiver protein n=1 Tax=Novosphingobium malaysiense TaxID=1348853 RepID=A0A0B1ZSE8_9SPHN|nr:response regulator [Novosphingobium malaysiense]KHK93581.1 response regulator receiver protein [Novosphingobium malaysiense]